jgi:hypothetical protein
VNAIYLAGNEETKLPPFIPLKGIKPAQKSSIQLLGSTIKLKWKTVNGETRIIIPESLQKTPPCSYAWTFTISQVE